MELGLTIRTGQELAEQRIDEPALEPRPGTHGVMAVTTLPADGIHDGPDFLRSRMQLRLAHLVGIHPESLHQYVVVRHPHRPAGCQRQAAAAQGLPHHPVRPAAGIPAGAHCIDRLPAVILDPQTLHETQHQHGRSPRMYREYQNQRLSVLEGILTLAGLPSPAQLVGHRHGLSLPQRGRQLPGRPQRVSST